MVLVEYIHSALKKANYEWLEEEGCFYGEIPGLDGVYATGPTKEECKKELKEVLEGWILIRVSRNLPIPAIGGVKISVQRAV